MKWVKSKCSQVSYRIAFVKNIGKFPQHIIDGVFFAEKLQASNL